jgi:hypothetical protein
MKLNLGYNINLCGRNHDTPFFDKRFVSFCLLRRFSSISGLPFLKGRSKITAF